jgi:hypothetical protein
LSTPSTSLQSATSSATFDDVVSILRPEQVCSRKISIQTIFFCAQVRWFYCHHGDVRWIEFCGLSGVSSTHICQVETRYSSKTTTEITRVVASVGMSAHRGARRSPCSMVCTLSI